MIIYLHRGTDRATAEIDETAARLEAQGWVRCTEDVHKVLWKIGDATDKARIAREDAGDALKERTI